MNRYDELYHFRQAKLPDVENIMKFIREEWREGHILGNDRELFLWQHGRTEYHDFENINYILMLDSDERVVGSIGFVSYTNDNAFISTTMTVISPKVRLPMSGVEMIRRQMSTIGETGNFSSGTNPRTLLPIFQKVFRRKTGYMQKYYILNDMVHDYKIAKSGMDQATPYEEYKYELMEVDDFSEITGAYDCSHRYEHMPHKSAEYIEKRFFHHPYYQYRKWKVVSSDNDVVALLFGREVEVEDRKALLLVDYQGDLKHIEKLGLALHKLMYEKGYEYIDFLASDLSFIDTSKAGFQLLDPDDPTIIPDHFEPFEKANIKSWYQTNMDVVIFKADGDQDRPNVLRR